jgi:hypothetical protein
MSIVDTIKRLFGGTNASEDADEREEYGGADPGAADLRARPTDAYGRGSERAVADELDDEFRAPRDAAP